MRARGREKRTQLVFPAASRPSMRRRISLDPKILPIILEIWPPMPAVASATTWEGKNRRSSRFLRTASNCYVRNRLDLREDGGCGAVRKLGGKFSERLSTR